MHSDSPVGLKLHCTTLSHDVNIYFVGSFPSIAGISPARVGISPSSPDAIENYHHAHKGAKTLRKNSPHGSPDAIENYHQVRKNAANKKQSGNKKAPISRGKTY
jgi:hypothetical protein